MVLCGCVYWLLNYETFFLVHRTFLIIFVNIKLTVAKYRYKYNLCACVRCKLISSSSMYIYIKYIMMCCCAAHKSLNERMDGKEKWLHNFHTSIARLSLWSFFFFFLHYSAHMEIDATVRVFECVCDVRAFVSSTYIIIYFIKLAFASQWWWWWWLTAHLRLTVLN